MNGERGELGSDQFDALFGSKIENSLRNEGCNSLVMIPDFYQMDELKTVADGKGYDVEQSRWIRANVAYLVPRAYGTGCLVIIFVNHLKNASQAYIFDKDQERFDAIFKNGAVG